MIVIRSFIWLMVALYSQGAGSLARPGLKHAKAFWGNSIINRGGFILSGAEKSWIDFETVLPNGILQSYHAFIHDISQTTNYRKTRIRLQVWRPEDVKNHIYQLKWEKIINISTQSKVGPSQWVLSNQEQFHVKEGDRIGWTNEGPFGAISFQSESRHRTHFRTIRGNSLPRVGTSYFFDNIYLPSIFSVGVVIKSKVTMNVTDIHVSNETTKDIANGESIGYNTTRCCPLAPSASPDPTLLHTGTPPLRKEALLGIAIPVSVVFLVIVMVVYVSCHRKRKDVSDWNECNTTEISYVPESIAAASKSEDDENKLNYTSFTGKTSVREYQGLVGNLKEGIQLNAENTRNTYGEGEKVIMTYGGDTDNSTNYSVPQNKKHSAKIQSFHEYEEILESEWDLVHRELYSGDTTQQRHAVARIAVWKCRLLHKLSPGIECTAQLVNAQIEDRVAQQSGRPQQQGLSIRMNYSMALVRFVNLLTERGQTRQFAQPVHMLAEELGLPEWLVDLRHEATHSGLPSLQLLRAAAEYALAWLKTEYWEAQREEPDTGDSAGSHNPDSPEDPEQRVCQILVDYMDIQFKILGEGNSKAQKRMDQRLLRQVMSQLDGLVSTNSETVVSVLSQEGFMPASVEQLQALGLDLTELSSGKDLMLPDKMLSFWRPVLKLFHQKHLTSLLLQGLLSEAGEQSRRTEQLMGWTFTLLQALANAGRRHSLQNLYTQRCHLNGKLLLQLCMERPNSLTSQLLPCLFRLNSCGVNAHQQEQLLRLSAFYTTPADQLTDQLTNQLSAQLTAQQADPGDDSPMDIDALLKLKTNMPCTSGHTDFSGEDSSPADSPWILAKGIVDWSKYCLGSCPRFNVDAMNLELPGWVDDIDRADMEMGVADHRDQADLHGSVTDNADRGVHTRTGGRNVNDGPVTSSSAEPRQEPQEQQGDGSIPSLNTSHWTAEQMRAMATHISIL